MDDIVFYTWESLGSQPASARQLEKALPKAMGVSWLWVGPSGSGKRTFARILLRRVFCEQNHEDPKCPDCRRAVSGTHPDAVWWELPPEKREWLIDDMRELRRLLSGRPLAADRRVVVLTKADHTRPDAQDILLKVLEEPPRDTLLVLLAERRSRFLPTVLSRLKEFRFHPVPREIIVEHLKRFHGFEPQQAEDAAGVCNGSFETALREKDADWRVFREYVQKRGKEVLNGLSESLWASFPLELRNLEWPAVFGEEPDEAASERRRYQEAWDIWLSDWKTLQEEQAAFPQKVSRERLAIAYRVVSEHRDLLEGTAPPIWVWDRLVECLRRGMADQEQETAFAKTGRFFQ